MGRVPPYSLKGLKRAYRDAQKAEVTGGFSGWSSLHPFTKDQHGVWRAEIHLPGPGRYPYKFLINGNRWIDDPSNGMKEPDNYGGFDSILQIV